MKTITLKCDRCGKEESLLDSDIHKNKLNLQIVGVCEVDPNAYHYGTCVPQSELRAKAEWCIACREQIGLHPMFKDGERVQPAVQLTLEQQLVELLRQFVQENSPQQQ